MLNLFGHADEQAPAGPDGDADRDRALDEIDLDGEEDLIETAARASRPDRATGEETGGDRERRVIISEARALIDRGRRLLDRMSADDREETTRLTRAIEQAINGGDWERLRAVSADLADLLFYVEEG